MKGLSTGADKEQRGIESLIREKKRPDQIDQSDDKATRSEGAAAAAVLKST